MKQQANVCLELYIALYSQLVLRVVMLRTFLN